MISLWSLLTNLHTKAAIFQLLKMMSTYARRRRELLSILIKWIMLGTAGGNKDELISDVLNRDAPVLATYIYQEYADIVCILGDLTGAMEGTSGWRDRQTESQRTPCYHHLIYIYICIYQVPYFNHSVRIWFNLTEGSHGRMIKFTALRLNWISSEII